MSKVSKKRRRRRPKTKPAQPVRVAAGDSPPTPPPPPRVERRRHPRFQVLAQIELRHHGDGDGDGDGGGDDDGEVAILPVLDISAGGAFVALEPPAAHLAIGDLIWVYIDVPGEPLDVTLRAKVVRIQTAGERPGIGLEWGLHSMEVAERFTRVLTRLRQLGLRRAA